MKHPDHKRNIVMLLNIRKIKENAKRWWDKSTKGASPYVGKPPKETNRRKTTTTKQEVSYSSVKNE